jgi:hypothetical protein
MNLDALNAYQDDLREYFARASFLIKQGNTAEHPEWARSTAFVLAIYALQAAFEVARTAVSFSLSDADKTKRLRKEFLEFASVKVRYLYLMDALRNHDFHRHALTFREGKVATYGPMIMKVREAGEAVAGFPDETGRFTFYRTKDGKEIAQPHHRNDAIQLAGFNVMEPESGKWMDILQVLVEHGTDLQALLMRDGAAPSSTPG